MSDVKKLCPGGFRMFKKSVNQVESQSHRSKRKSGGSKQGLSENKPSEGTSSQTNVTDESKLQVVKGKSSTKLKGMGRGKPLQQALKSPPLSSSAEEKSLSASGLNHKNDIEVFSDDAHSRLDCGDSRALLLSGDKGLSCKNSKNVSNPPPRLLDLVLVDRKNAVTSQTVNERKGVETCEGREGSRPRMKYRRSKDNHFNKRNMLAPKASDLNQDVTSKTPTPVLTSEEPQKVNRSVHDDKTECDERKKQSSLDSVNLIKCMNKIQSMYRAYGEQSDESHSTSKDFSCNSKATPSKRDNTITNAENISSHTKLQQVEPTDSEKVPLHSLSAKRSKDNDKIKKDDGCVSAVPKTNSLVLCDNVSSLETAVENLSIKSDRCKRHETNMKPDNDMTISSCLDTVEKDNDCSSKSQNREDKTEAIILKIDDIVSQKNKEHAVNLSKTPHFDDQDPGCCDLVFSDGGSLSEMDFPSPNLSQEDPYPKSTRRNDQLHNERSHRYPHAYSHFQGYSYYPNVPLNSPRNDHEHGVNPNATHSHYYNVQPPTMGHRHNSFDGRLPPYVLIPIERFGSEESIQHVMRYIEAHKRKMQMYADECYGFCPRASVLIKVFEVNEWGEIPSEPPCSYPYPYNPYPMPHPSTTVSASYLYQSQVPHEPHPRQAVPSGRDFSRLGNEREKYVTFSNQNLIENEETHPSDVDYCRSQEKPNSTYLKTNNSEYLCYDDRSASARNGEIYQEESDDESASCYSTAPSESEEVFSQSRPPTISELPSVQKEAVSSDGNMNGSISSFLTKGHLANNWQAPKQSPDSNTLVKDCRSLPQSLPDHTHNASKFVPSGMSSRQSSNVDHSNWRKGSGQYLQSQPQPESQLSSTKQRRLNDRRSLPCPLPESSYNGFKPTPSMAGCAARHSRMSSAQSTDGPLYCQEKSAEPVRTMASQQRHNVPAHHLDSGWRPLPRLGQSYEAAQRDSGSTFPCSISADDDIKEPLANSSNLQSYTARAEPPPCSVSPSMLSVSRKRKNAENNSGNEDGARSNFNNNNGDEDDSCVSSEFQTPKSAKRQDFNFATPWSEEIVKGGSSERAWNPHRISPWSEPKTKEDNLSDRSVSPLSSKSHSNRFEYRPYNKEDRQRSRSLSSERQRRLFAGPPPSPGQASPSLYSNSSGNSYRPRRSFDGNSWKAALMSRSRGYINKFVDSHCHIDFLYSRIKFPSVSFDEFREKHADSFPANYGGCIAVFCNPRTFQRFRPDGNDLLNIVSKDKDVWIAAGCHPKNAMDFREEHYQGLIDILKMCKNVVALGEIGLDYSGKFGMYKERQKEVFKQQLYLALSLNLPIVIHCRDADDDCLEILKEMVPRHHKIHGHCFTRDLKTAHRWMSLFPNLYLGLTPLITYQSAVEAIETAAGIPLERLLLETDSPYFLPTGTYLSQNNEKYSHPGLAIFTAETVARLKGVPVEAVLKATRENTHIVYGV